MESLDELTERYHAALAAHVSPNVGQSPEALADR